MLRYIHSKINLNMFCISHLIRKIPSMQSLSVKMFHLLAIYQLNPTSLFSFSRMSSSLHFWVFLLFSKIIKSTWKMTNKEWKERFLFILYSSFFFIHSSVFRLFSLFLVFISSFIISFHSFISFIGSSFIFIRIFSFLYYLYLFPLSFVAVSFSSCHYTKPPAVSNNILSVKFLPFFPFLYCVMSKLCPFFPVLSLLDFQLLFASFGFIRHWEKKNRTVTSFLPSYSL